MRPRFREEKATQAAARFVQRAGGRMSHLKLVKLLYLLDREALLRWGRPVTYDQYVAMDHGPVPSRCLDLINGFVPQQESSYWSRHITERENHEVGLRNAEEPPADQMSRAEEDLIDELYRQFGRMSKWQVRDYTHDLPEWRDPEGSSLPISIDDILRSGGVSEDEIAEIEDGLEGVAVADHLFG